MFCKLSVLALFLAVLNISRSSEVQHKSDETLLLNSDVLGKKLLPAISHLLTENSASDRQKFLHLLNGLNVEEYRFVNDTPFTIIVPKINFDTANLDKTAVAQFVFEHIVPGTQVKSLRNGESYGNLNRNPIHIRNSSPEHWTVNDANVLKFNSMSTKLISFIEIDGYLNDRKNNFAKRNIQEHNSYNEPQKLTQKDVNKSDSPAKESKINYLLNYLSSMKSGTKVFQHFLISSNLSQILEDTTHSYIILIPSDSAFQRWHPIDWGFYPFSVPEFTENILRKHVIQQKQPFNLKDIDKEQQMRTMGGDNVVFRNNPTPSVNNVSIMSNATLSNGNDIFIISEVLFMSESVVSKLHQQNKDKETPPLLAFPWFGAQFLSHAFLAIERDNRFNQITRLLNNAEIASHIIGSNYTFFVPFDDAFEKYGIDLLPDEALATEKAIKMILNHFVKGRLYNRDLIDGKMIESVGGKPLKITRDENDQVSVNGARIVVSEVFVYNLGTMFYIDDILYPESLTAEVKAITASPNQRRTGESSEESYTTEIPIFSEKEERFSTKSSREPTTSEYQTQLSALLTTRSDVEFVASAFTEFSSLEDFSNGESMMTPRALPLQQQSAPPKK